MSFWRLYYHLVWATKYREPLITPELEEPLWSCLVRKAAELETTVYAINGWRDHVHLVVSIPPQRAVATVVKHIKGASAHEINQSNLLNVHFAWQRGYGVLSLGERQRPIAEAYVQNQKAHHQNQTVNMWLEHCAEHPEGPLDVGIIFAAPATIHEQPADYDTWGEIPF